MFLVIISNDMLKHYIFPLQLFNFNCTRTEKENIYTQVAVRFLLTIVLKVKCLLNRNGHSRWCGNYCVSWGTRNLLMICFSRFNIFSQGIFQDVTLKTLYNYCYQTIYLFLNVCVDACKHKNLMLTVFKTKTGRECCNRKKMLGIQVTKQNSGEKEPKWFEGSCAEFGFLFLWVKEHSGAVPNPARDAYGVPCSALFLQKAENDWDEKIDRVLVAVSIWCWASCANIVGVQWRPTLHLLDAWANILRSDWQLWRTVTAES